MMIIFLPLFFSLAAFPNAVELSSSSRKYPNPSKLTLTPAGMVPTVSYMHPSASEKHPTPMKDSTLGRTILSPTEMIPTPRRRVITPPSTVPIPPSTSRSPLFYKGEGGALYPLPLNANLYKFRSEYIGEIVGNRVFPLYDEEHNIVWQKIAFPYASRVAGPEVSNEFKIPGTLEQVAAACERWANIKYEAD